MTMTYRNLYWTLYRRGRDWRWRVKTRNGRIVGASTEGYRSAPRAGANAQLFGAPHLFGRAGNERSMQTIVRVRK